MLHCCKQWKETIAQTEEGFCLENKCPIVGMRLKAIPNPNLLDGGNKKQQIECAENEFRK